MILSSLSIKQRKMGLVLLAYIAFISLGLPDGLLGVAWPSVRQTFSLPLDALGLWLAGGVTGYLTASFLNGYFISRIGVGGLLAASCATTGIALIAYTQVPAWWMIIAFGVMAGLGAGAIDAGLNTYIAAHYGEGWMQWLHASYGIGVTLGPLIMTTGLNLSGTWRVGYMAVGAAQLVLAACFGLTIKFWSQPAFTTDAAPQQKLTDYKTPLTETLRQPTAWLSILMFFLYTGMELLLGHWGYTLLTESRGIAPSVAGWWAGGYWGMFTVGRILAGLITRHLSLDRLVQTSLILAAVGAGLVWWNPTSLLCLIGIALTGFAIAPIFPGLVSGTSRRVNMQHTANTIGMQIGAAGLGGAVLPGVAGWLAEQFSLEVIPAYLMGLIVTLLVLYRVAMQWDRR